MNDQTLTIDGVRVPRFLYGTAWKEDRTQRLAELALEQGFRGIDTANQRRHYYEEGVGQAIRTSISSGLVTRDDLFLQTKFTFKRGQDHRLPYDPAAPIATQVEQSLVSSLEHLGTDVIDAFLLHGPTYQGFSLLTANRDLLAKSEIVEVAKRHGRSVAQVVFRFALEIGMIALTGTTNAEHMRADLEVFGFCLEAGEVEQIERLGQR